jgi:acetyl esterase/lipase
MSNPRAAFKAMFDDIAMDLNWPLHHPEQLPQGGRFYRDVVYAAPWGFRPLMLDVTVPRGDGPHPTIVFIHGGAWAAGHPTITNSVYRKMDFFGRFHKAGFAVARVAYRFSAEAKFPTQLHDCKSAIRFLRKHAAILGLDANRFGVMGDSAGGHLATLVGLTSKGKALEGKVGETKGSSAVSCVVNWFGPTDFLTMQKQKLKLKSLSNTDAANSAESLLIGGPVQRRKKEARAASPITYVHKGAPPMLLQYGDKDRLVPFEQGLALFEALKAKRCDVTLQRIAGADHCFWGTAHDHVVDDDIAFFKKHLG